MFVRIKRLGIILLVELISNPGLRCANTERAQVNYGIQEGLLLPHCAIPALTNIAACRGKTVSATTVSADCAATVSADLARRPSTISSC
jgi:hypothetical protein